jgi:carbon monoxide dehydrogenase subunit G
MPYPATLWTGQAASPNLDLRAPYVQSPHHLGKVIEVHKTIHVSMPTSQVYEYLTQPDNIAEYVGPIRRIYDPSTPKVETGTRLTVEVSFLGRRFEQRAECTRRDAPEVFEARSVGGRFYFEAGFNLREEPHGTQMDGWGRANAPGLFGVAEALLGFLIEHQAERDLTRLKSHLESLRV